TVALLSAGHPVAHPDEGMPQAHAYRTARRGRVLDPAELSRPGARFSDPIGGYVLVQIRVHGCLPESVYASGLPANPVVEPRTCAMGCNRALHVLSIVRSTGATFRALGSA